MDVRMPRLDGIEATRRLLAADGEARVLALTTFDLDEYVYAAVRAGASGFLLKDVKPSDLVHAVEVVARGEAMLAPAADPRGCWTASPAHRLRVSSLTSSPTLPARELEVLREVATGASNARSRPAVPLGGHGQDLRLAAARSRLDLRDRVQLAVLAYESGLVGPGST